MGVRYFAAAAALASLAALTLTACGPKTESGQSAASSTNGGVMGGLFPARQAPYKATYKIGDSGQEMVIYASNGKMRSEAMIKAMGKLKPVSLIDRDAKQFVSFMEGPGAPKRATKLSADDLKQYDAMMPRGDTPVKPAKIGADTVAGMGCNVWQLPDVPKGAPNFPEGAPGEQLCMTDDGIMLRAGPADKPHIIATALERGPQDPALFALPPGYTVVDMGDCLAIMRGYAEAMRSGGAKPDQAKLAECQKKMMAGMGAP